MPGGMQRIPVGIAGRRHRRLVPLGIGLGILVVFQHCPDGDIGVDPCPHPVAEGMHESLGIGFARTPGGPLVRMPARSVYLK